jgi:transposase InsO family protein
MLDLVQRGYVWQGMRKQIERYVQNGHTCQASKPSRSKTLRLLEPLPVPWQIWKSITLDFISGLPEDGAMNTILVVVNRFSKMAHFIPTMQEISTEDTAELLLHHVWKLHGTPEEIILDRGLQFVSARWKCLCQRLGIVQNLSTAYHPQIMR